MVIIYPRTTATSLFRKRVVIYSLCLIAAALLTGGCKMLFKHESTFVDRVEGAKRPVNGGLAKWAGALNYQDSARSTTASDSVDHSLEARRLHFRSIGYEFFAVIVVTRAGEFMQHPDDPENLTTDNLARYATKYGADLFFVKFNEPYFGYSTSFASGVNYAQTVGHHYSGRTYTLELYYRR